MCLIKTSEQLKFLDIISYPEIEINKNTFTFIIGKSGCGKSTYLKMLNGTVLPTDGKIMYQKTDIRELEVIELRRKVMLVPQEVFLFEGTIQENFVFYYEAREEKLPNTDKIKASLHTCCMDFPLNTQCSNLSGGERARVFLAIFLSFDSDVLLLDEPTASLDSKTAVVLLANIKQFCSEHERTAVLVCHNEELVNQFADQILQF